MMFSRNRILYIVNINGIGSHAGNSDVSGNQLSY